jgi:LDH2 family malate/lactate/ureidoglycolate dehydrogenase
MANDQQSYLFSSAYLKDFSAKVFMHFGVPAGDAKQATDVLAKSDLRGIDSHGVARLHTYFDMLELGRINPKPKIKVVREKFSVVTVDGDNGLGLVVGPRANEIAGGAQLPLGSEAEMGGHKGYALAAMVDILTAVLSGANWGPFAPPFALRQEIPTRSVGKGIGHFFGAMQIDGFIEKDEFKKQIDEWRRVLRNTKPAAGTSGPLIPGDPEREAEAIRSKVGIPLLKPVVDDLLDISKKTGIPFEVS